VIVLIHLVSTVAVGCFNDVVLFRSIVHVSTSIVDTGSTTTASTTVVFALAVTDGAVTDLRATAGKVFVLPYLLMSFNNFQNMVLSFHFSKGNDQMYFQPMNMYLCTFFPVVQQTYDFCFFNDSTGILYFSLFIK
jgi:hypothetical protein